MKILVILAFVSVAACAPAIEGEGIHNDIADFMEVIPIEKIKKIAIQHLHDDPEFQAAVKYMKSPEWVSMIKELVATPEAQAVDKFLNDSGIYLAEYGKKLCEFVHNVKVETDHPVRSLKGFVNDVREIIPLAKLIQMFDDKMTNSEEFKAMYEKLTSEEAHTLLNNIRGLPVFKKMVVELKDMGVDLDRIFKIIYAVFGWTDGAPTKV